MLLTLRTERGGLSQVLVQGQDLLKQFGLSKHQGGNYVIGNNSAHHFGAVVNRGAA